MTIENAQIFSSEKGFQAIVDGRYFRSVDFGRGAEFIRDTDATPASIKARIAGCKTHTFIGLKQMNPALAFSLENAAKEAK